MMGFENNQPVPIVIPNVEEMDTFADFVAEELSKGKSHEQIVQEQVETRLSEREWEKIASVLLAILDDTKPKLAVRSMMWASGMLAEGNLTLPQIARIHGTTKQAVQQKGERLRVKLNLPLSPFMRSMEARENMRKANFRKPKNGN
jgi:hypothetical protein